MKIPRKLKKKLKKSGNYGMLASVIKMFRIVDKSTSKICKSVVSSFGTVLKAMKYIECIHTGYKSAGYK